MSANFPIASIVGFETDHRNGPIDRGKKRGIRGGRGPIAGATAAGSSVYARLTAPVAPPKKGFGKEVWSRLGRVFGKGSRPTPGAGPPLAESKPT